MLVLSRQRHQEIIIGTGDTSITIRVVEFRGDRVRLGIVAPRDVPVHRREVWDAIQGEQS